MNENFYRAFEDAHRGSRESVLQRLQAYIPVLNAIATEHHAPSALDLGCGRGEWLELLGRMNFQAAGVDLDPGMLHASEQRGLNVKLQDGLHALQEKDSNCLELISLFHVVEHVEFNTLLALCSESFRVLKPGGVLLIETPNPENLTVGTHSFYLDPTHSKPIAQQLLAFVVQQAGFEQVNVLRLNHPSGIGETENLRLVNVLFHVSPDYAVLAVKDQMRNTQASEQMRHAVQTLKGYGLEQLSEALSMQQASEQGQLRMQLQSLSDEVAMRKYENKSLETAVLNLQAEITDMKRRSCFSGLARRVVNRIRALQNRSTRTRGKKKVLVDVSNVSKHDLKTGIERVVKAYLAELVQQPHLEVVPVRLEHIGGQWQYVSHPVLEVVHFQADDLLWGLDYNPHNTHQAEVAGLYRLLRTQGVRVVFQMYDTLPVTHPQYFPPGAGDVHALWMRSICQCADDLLCISQAVADALRTWAASLGIEIRPTIHAIHLGADLPTNYATTATVPSAPMPSAGQYLLSVGTLEPRKGHDQALDALELLWARGSNLAYVIVGQEGWKAVPAAHRQYIAALCTRIRQHPELGKRLWWFESADDALLATLYQQAKGLLVPSRQEGYGLPLIEAAHYNKALLVRDIAVFREVAGEYATYFSGETAEDLANVIEGWAGHEAPPAPHSGKLHFMSWATSANTVFKALGLR